MGKDPHDVDCEWCGDLSTVCIERQRKIKNGVVGTGMFIYACDKHKHLAEAEQIIIKKRR